MGRSLALAQAAIGHLLAGRRGRTGTRVADAVEDRVGQRHLREQAYFVDGAERVEEHGAVRVDLEPRVVGAYVVADHEVDTLRAELGRRVRAYVVGLGRETDQELVGALLLAE